MWGRNKIRQEREQFFRILFYTLHISGRQSIFQPCGQSHFQPCCLSLWGDSLLRRTAFLHPGELFHSLMWTDDTFVMLRSSWSLSVRPRTAIPRQRGGKKGEKAVRFQQKLVFPLQTIQYSFPFITLILKTFICRIWLQQRQTMRKSVAPCYQEIQGPGPQGQRRHEETLWEKVWGGKFDRNVVCICFPVSPQKFFFFAGNQCSGDRLPFLRHFRRLGGGGDRSAVRMHYRAEVKQTRHVSY